MKVIKVNMILGALINMTVFKQPLSVLLSFALLLGINFNSHAGIPFLSSDTPSLAPMLEETTPAIVSISVSGTQEVNQQQFFREFFRNPNQQAPERQFRGLGSGVIIDAKKGFVVTNHHVVDNADEITVKLTDGRELVATKLGADELSDIALLKIDAEDLTDIDLANSDELRVGDFVVAIGNPFGLSQTVTSGIVSALGRSGLNIGGYEDFIQTDAAINRGNSGGALVNLNGELIGINTAIFGPNGGNVGIGFAIPSNMMKSLIDQIAEFGEVRRGLLGILGNDVDAALAEAMNSKVNMGAFVREVVVDSAADAAGIEPGDIITEINGNNLNSFSELRAKVGSLVAGTEIELGIIRNGEKQTLAVTLGSAGIAQIESRDIHPALEGAELENDSMRVLVSSVEPRSPAARIGLREGDIILEINLNRITNLSDLQEQFDSSKDVFSMRIQRGNAQLYKVIR